MDQQHRRTGAELAVGDLELADRGPLKGRRAHSPASLIEACRTPSPPSIQSPCAIAEDEGFAWQRRVAVLDLGVDRLRLGGGEALLERLPVVRVVDVAGDVDVGGAEGPRDRSQSAGGSGCPSRTDAPRPAALSR